MAVLPAVKAAIWSVNREQRFTGDTMTLERYMDRLIAQRRFNMAVLALFGVLGLVIAAVGIYGVMAYVVAQRTNEIGVRMALGATRGNVVSMVLRRAGALMALGLLHRRPRGLVPERRPQELPVRSAAQRRRDLRRRPRGARLRRTPGQRAAGPPRRDSRSFDCATE